MHKKVHHFDLWDNTHHDIGVSRIRNADCETCGKEPVFPSLQTAGNGSYAVLCGRDAVQVLPDSDRPISLRDAEKIGHQTGGFVKSTPYFVELKVNGKRAVMFADGRLLIHGIRSVAEGRKFYHQLFG